MEKKDRRARVSTLNVKLADDLNESLDRLASDMGLRLSDVTRFALYDYVRRYTNIELKSAPKVIVTPPSQL